MVAHVLGKSLFLDCKRCGVVKVILTGLIFLVRLQNKKPSNHLFTT